MNVIASVSGARIRSRRMARRASRIIRLVLTGASRCALITVTTIASSEFGIRNAE
jgi:hypothetical protein